MLYKTMKIFEQFINNRRRRNSLERSVARQSLELSEIRFELAKMSTEIARLKTSRNKQEEKPHGREQ